MEGLINGANFVHDDETQYREFLEVIRRFRHNSGKPCTRQDALNAVSAIEQKLLKEPQPGHGSKGWDQAVNACLEIGHYLEDVINKDKDAALQLHDKCYTFMVQLFKNRRNMLHMKISADCLQHRHTEMKEYIQKLERSELQPLISAICQDLKLEEDVKCREYGDIYQRFMRQLMKETLTKQQCSMFTAELLDLAVYLYLECGHVQEDSCRRLADTGKLIIDALDDPFINLQDIERIRSYIKHCGETLRAPGFPSHKEAAAAARECMSKLLTALSKRSLVVEIYNEVFDLILDAAKCQYSEENYNVEVFSDVHDFFRRLPKKALQKNPDLFVAMAKRFSAVLEELDEKFLNGCFAQDVLSYGLNKLYADNKEVAKQWLELLVPLFKHPTADTMRACYNILSNDKGYKWKDHAEIAQHLFDLINAFPLPKSDKERDEKEVKKLEEFLKYFADSVKYFFEGLKKSKMVKNYSRGMLNLSLKFMATNHNILIEIAEEIAERTELNPKEDKAMMVKKMKEFHEILKNEDHPWNESWPLQRAANDFIDSCMQPFKDGKAFTDEELSVFVSIGLTCLKYDFIHPETGQFPSVYFSIFLTVMKMLNTWLQALNKINLAADMVQPLMAGLDVDDSTVVQLCAMYIYIFGLVPSGQKVLAPYLEDLIKVYLDKEEDQLLQAITQVYPNNPKAFQSYFPAFMDLLENNGEQGVITNIAQLFQKVSKKQAELFRDQDIKTLLEKAQENMNAQIMIVEIIKELCKRRPESVIPYFHMLQDRSAWSSMVSYWLTDMQCTLALYKEELAPTVLDDLLTVVKSGQDKSSTLTAFNFIRMVGFKYPDLLKPRRAEISAMQLIDMDEINLRQLVLDMIDGKTSEEMLSQLQKQQQDLQDLVGRVDETEEAIADVKDELGRQGEQVDNMKTEVTVQGQHLDKVEQTVDETVAKVDEIDQKTLSHAPFWARDISKLLNPVSEHDWRLLSSRLGYSNNDIRGWAQQADPCMAMLNEWYTTHKTSEATFAVLSQLQEMDRMDAAIIVENAMKNAEAVVEDEDFQYASPPPIFISYQWAHQPEVKLLKQHLEKAGYECWLDIGQMGGGDKLFEKIDDGIRAAKVIISCVTTKYAKSPNCNREVNLSVSLNKPIIPLLLEKCTWPPPGSMGPIFSEYLFVRFFQREGEETTDNRYWSKEKFQELLMQLNLLGLPPEGSKIEPEYKNWWIPAIEEIKIDKSKAKNGIQVSHVEQTEEDKKAAESPDVFISYQWGKQKNIIKLYDRLTSLGFTCWLDIKQMGGGDSLFDKIDKGLRGCKVVLSCVTQKYALSANCRREVSLTDALQKPLLPLLLENMTWPPPGPMSMIMTQLLYINFAKDESVQMAWEGPKFEELLTKIREHVPNVIITDKKPSNMDLNARINNNVGPSSVSTISANKQPDSSMTSQQHHQTILAAKDPLKAASPQQSFVATHQKEPLAPKSSSSKQSISNLPSSKTHQITSSSSAADDIYKAASPQQTITLAHQKDLPTTTFAQARHQITQRGHLTKPEPSSSLQPLETKLRSVTKFSSLTKQSTRLAPTQRDKVEQQNHLSVSSRTLLKPISSNPTEKLPLSQSDVPSKTHARLTVSKQTNAAVPPLSQRPTRLPPLQYSRTVRTQVQTLNDKQTNSSQDHLYKPSNRNKAHIQKMGPVTETMQHNISQARTRESPTQTKQLSKIHAQERKSPSQTQNKTAQ